MKIAIIVLSIVILNIILFLCWQHSKQETLKDQASWRAEVQHMSLQQLTKYKNDEVVRDELYRRNKEIEESLFKVIPK
jgi:hypothetical protein